MRILDNGQLLKTKIVATVGQERNLPGKEDEIFDPDGNPVKGVLKHGELLSWLIHKGVDVIRINMSFASEQEMSSEQIYGADARKILQWVLANRDGLAKNVAVLGDLPGPKMRLNINAPVAVERGDPFLLNFVEEQPRGEQEATVLVNDQPFNSIATVNGFPDIDAYVNQSVRRGEEVVFSIGDGKVLLRANTDQSGTGIIKCEVIKRGPILYRKGITIRRADITVPPFLEQDQKALRFLLEEGPNAVSYIAVSFVNSAEDILKIKYQIEKQLTALYGANARRYSPGVVAKIETRLAWKNLDDILDVSDCVMVARGDLGLQLNPQEVPAIQKEIIRRCNLRGKPVITATQMLDSMETSLEPTRAEANDVFNAIQDGSDAVMLSGETSIGKYPAQAVEMMAQIAEQAEKFYAEKRSGRAYKVGLQDTLRDSEESSATTTRRLGESKTQWAVEAAASNIPDAEREEYLWRGQLYDQKVKRSQKQTTTDSISESTCLLSAEKDYSGILAPTTSGRTARMIARFRPQVPVIGVAHDESNARKLILSFGVYPLSIGEGQPNVEEVFKAACNEAVKPGYVPWRPEFRLLKKNDQVVATSGTPLMEIGTTNLIQIRKLE
jgi:pyruvate kinase